MNTPDLGPILDDLAAGRIDAVEARRRIDAAKQAHRPQRAAAETDEAAETTTQGGPKTGGLSRVAVSAIGRRVRIEADPSVSTLTVSGPHVLRRVGTVMEVSSSGEFGPSFSGFSLIRPPRSLDDLRDIGLGKELLIKVNPALIVDAEITTGGLRTVGISRLGRVRVTAGGSTIEDVAEVEDLLSQAGAVTVSGPISMGRSRLRVESGSLNINLTAGANVTIRGDSRLGRILWPGGGENVDEYVVGNGSAKLDVAVVMGMATIKVED